MFLLKKLKKHSEDRAAFYSIGFHGDQYLLKVVKRIAENCQYFVETGANLGSTIAYVAREYPHLTCFSCEPDPKAFEQAVQNTRDLKNVTLYNETSQDFLLGLEKEHPEIFAAKTMFWLDAHGYGFKWPLPFEIEYITTHFGAGYILIDDFKVPGQDAFVFHAYDGQECSFEYIAGHVNPKLAFRLYYPNYTIRTSTHHPLVGWGLIEFGNLSDEKLAESLADAVYLARETTVSPEAVHIMPPPK